MSKNETTEEDLLAHFDSFKPDPNDPAYVYATEVFNKASGCISVYGPIKICFEVNFSTLRARVCMNILGYDISCVELGVGTSETLRGKIDDAAKAEITITFEQNNLKASGKGCIKTVPYWSRWKCKTFEYFLLQW